MPDTLATARALASARSLASGRVLASARSRPTPLMYQLAHLWEFEDVTNLGLDSIAPTFGNLTNNNSCTQGAGVGAGSAVNFLSASNRYLSRSNNGTWTVPSTGFTLGAWMRLTTDTVSFQCAISLGNPGTTSSGSYALLYRGNGSTNRFRIDCQQSDGTASGGTSIRTANTFGAASTGVWYFVMGWLDGAALTLNAAVNAGTVDSNSYSGGINNYTGTKGFQLGKFDTQTSANMDLGQAFIYQRALTVAAERTYLYGAGAGRSLTQMQTATFRVMLADRLAGAFWKRGIVPPKWLRNELPRVGAENVGSGHALPCEEAGEPGFIRTDRGGWHVHRNLWLPERRFFQVARAF